MQNINTCIHTCIQMYVYVCKHVYLNTYSYVDKCVGADACDAVIFLSVGYRDQLLLLWNRAMTYIVYATVVIWRLLEVHIHKLILMSVFLVCVYDVSVCLLTFFCTYTDKRFYGSKKNVKITKKCLQALIPVSVCPSIHPHPNQHQPTHPSTIYLSIHPSSTVNCMY